MEHIENFIGTKAVLEELQKEINQRREKNQHDAIEYIEYSLKRKGITRNTTIIRGGVFGNMVDTYMRADIDENGDPCIITKQSIILLHAIEDFIKVAKSIST